MSYSILDAIGNTPLVEITRLNPNPDVKILAKLEYVKEDSAAILMLDHALAARAQK